MAILLEYILTVCLLGLISVQADSIMEFKKLQSEVFNSKASPLYEFAVEQRVKKMIELIESGEIPNEVQGDHNLAYLKSLDDNCYASDKCSLYEGLSKLQFLSKIDSLTENFESYLNVCLGNIRHSCSLSIYEHVKSHLNLDKQTDKIVKTLANEVELTFRPRPKRISRIKDIFVHDFHDIVLRTLRQLNPDESKKIAGKWINREKSLREYMDKIRSSCVTFIEQIDPAVELWSSYHTGFDSEREIDKLAQLHYTLKSCRKVVNNWESIVAASQRDASLHLIHHKVRKPHTH